MNSILQISTNFPRSLPRETDCFFWHQWYVLETRCGFFSRIAATWEQTSPELCIFYEWLKTTRAEFDWLSNAQEKKKYFSCKKWQLSKSITPWITPKKIFWNFFYSETTWSLSLFKDSEGVSLGHIPFCDIIDAPAKFLKAYLLEKNVNAQRTWLDRKIKGIRMGSAFRVPNSFEA